MFYSSAAVANGVLYAGSDDGKLYAYNAQSGALLWSAFTESAITGSPAVVNGMVYAGSNDGNLYAYAINGGNNAVYKNKKTQPPSFATLHANFRLKAAAPR